MFTGRNTAHWNLCLVSSGISYLAPRPMPFASPAPMWHRNQSGCCGAHHLSGGASSSSIGRPSGASTIFCDGIWVGCSAGFRMLTDMLSCFIMSFFFIDVRPKTDGWMHAARADSHKDTDAQSTKRLFFSEHTKTHTCTTVHKNAYKDGANTRIGNEKKAVGRQQCCGTPWLPARVARACRALVSSMMHEYVLAGRRAEAGGGG